MGCNSTPFPTSLKRKRTKLRDLLSWVATLHSFLASPQHHVLSSCRNAQRRVTRTKYKLRIHLWHTNSSLQLDSSKRLIESIRLAMNVSRVWCYLLGRLDGLLHEGLNSVQQLQDAAPHISIPSILSNLSLLNSLSAIIESALDLAADRL